MRSLINYGRLGFVRLHMGILAIAPVAQEFMGRMRRAFTLREASFVAFVVFLHVAFVYKTTIIATDSGYFLLNLYILLSGFFLLSRFFIVIFYTDSHRMRFNDSEYPSVSFVISAKNEADSIRATIDACMQSSYPGEIECVVIDDGSTDDTYAKMLAAKESHQNDNDPVTVIRFPENRGKREGMVEGVLHASGEVIVFVDSDSFVEPHALRHIVEHLMADPHVGAVAGNSGVANDDENHLTRMQSARYGISFDIFKACESVFGAVSCCPGCFSAYRKSAILSVMPKWRSQTFLGTKSTYGDDRSLTNYVLTDHSVVYCRKAKANTIVPSTYRKFLKQQLRWKKSWIREAPNAIRVFAKKHPLAAFSFYINLILPIASPLVVLFAVVIPILFHATVPWAFLLGMLGVGALYGLFYFWLSGSRHWWYTIPFTLFYAFVLTWQMPYALLKLRDTRWGTR